MRYIYQMAPSFINGSRQDRVRILGDVCVRFAVGAFIVSTIAHFVDPYIAANVSNNLTAIVGGLIVVIVGGCLKSV